MERERVGGRKRETKIWKWREEDRLVVRETD